MTEALRTFEDDADEPFLLQRRHAVRKRSQDLVLAAATEGVSIVSPSQKGKHVLSGSASELVELLIDLVDGELAFGADSPFGDDVVSDGGEVAGAFLPGSKKGISDILALM